MIALPTQLESTIASPAPDSSSRSQPAQLSITNQARPFKDFNTAERMQLLGSVSWLMLQSEVHYRYSIDDLVERIMPSLLRDQYRYYEQDGEPIGFFNWAWLTQSAEARIQIGNYVLQPEEWSAGNHLWFMEFMAPHGHGRLMVRDLRRNLFAKGTPAKALRIDSETGELRSIARYRI